MKTTIVTIEAEKQLCICIYVLNKVLTHFSPVLLLYRNQCVDLHSKSMECFLYNSTGLLNVASLGLYMTHIWLRISPVNVAKSAGNCRFGNIDWRNP